MKTLLSFLLCFISLGLIGQSYWTEINESNFKSLGERQIIPNDYRSFELDLKMLKSLLGTAPERFSTTNKNAETLLEVPLADGSMVQFQVYEAPMMEQELADKYPDIKTYVGIGKDDPLMRIRFDVTSKGFHAMIRTNDNWVFIDPYASDDDKHYVCYYKKDYPQTLDNAFACHFENTKVDKSKLSIEANDFKSMAGDCMLRSYRLAVATTGEYTSFHGGSTSGLSAVVTAINRVNEVYENDLAITFNLIGNNDLIIYTNSSTDPYTNNNGSAMLSQNQSNLNSVIGSANYDIGHVFSTGGGGIAGWGVVCTNNKAHGVTGLPTPTGDPFYIDYVAHEIGHQFGGSHTFNNSCNSNRYGPTAVEPGSGSTIMGYAGICSPNVQDNSDPYFHAISLQEMSFFSNNSSGNACANTISTGNSQPIVEDVPNYVIPISTPFSLTAEASDANGDVLTYCWEQMDNEIASMPPNSSSTGGPLFRSLNPTTSPTRTFPNMTTIVFNSNNTWEKLPSVSRSMDFRVTIRDNRLGGGCTTEDDVQVTSTTSAGPFLVTNPNSSTTWNVGSIQTITWDVANTNVAPVSCANVDVLMSTDGGYTYPITLASGVANNGSYTITVPNYPSNLCRIKIACSDNIFFDISNQNFSIDASVPSFLLDAISPNLSICQGENAVFNIPITAIAGFNNSINLSVSGVPSGAAATFSNNPATAGSTVNLTISNTASLVSGNYNLVLNGVSGSDSKNLNLVLSVGTPSSPTLDMPAYASLNVALLPTLSWDEVLGASSYSIEIASDFNFLNLIESTNNISGNEYTVNTALDELSTYYWRISAINNCGNAVSSTYYFETANLVYCSSSGVNTNFEWIQAVSIADINNSSGNNGGYQDFTNIVGNVIAGDSYPVSLTPGFSGQTYPEYWRIWIDFNRDGDFTDGNETVFDSNGTFNSTVTGTMNIPADVASGAATMRVSMNWDAPQSPCGNLDYAEIEDYTVMIATNCIDTDNDGVCNSDDLCPNGDDNVDIDNNGTPDACQASKVALKVMLEGAYNPTLGQMDTKLNDLGLLPLSHPYDDPNTYNYQGTATVSSFPTNVVDWIYVEARSGLSNSNFVEHKIGLLLNDGSIKDLDGVSDLSFNLPIGGNYYFVVRHRNHLDVMTASSLTHALTMSYDFTSNATQAYIGVQKTLPDGKAVMFAGDIDQSMDIQNNDYDSWKIDPAILQTYDLRDISLDGQVQVTDADMWYNNRSTNSPPELDY